VWRGLLLAQTLHEPNVVIVKFERSFVESELQAVLHEAGQRRTAPQFRTPSVRRLSEQHSVVNFTQMFRTDPRHAERHKAFNLDLFFRVEFSADESPERVAESFMMDNMVISAEPNFVNTISIVPDDDEFSYQWGLRNMLRPGFDINVEAAWEITTGDPRVVVAIIDDCVDFLHEDLQPNLWTNEGEIPGNWIDDDTNGFVDDIHGWNFVDNNNFVLPHADEDAHGTHVAGIVGARSNNGRGIAGVAGGWGDEPGASLMVFRAGFRDPSDGMVRITHGYEAMIYAADNGAAIVNASWGGSGISLAGNSAIRYFIRYGGGEVMSGGLIVAAAGNQGSQNVGFPAADFDVLAVGSITESGQRSSFSNYGAMVDISAPGSRIRSTMPPNDRYGYLSGTSMAAPMVSGVAALVLSATADFPRELKTPRWLSNVLITSGRNISGLEMGPLVDAHAAVLLAIEQLEAMLTSTQSKPTHAVLSIYPNPTSDIVRIVAQPEAKISSYRLINLGGTTVFQRQNPSLEETIDMTSLPAGTYILLVETDSGFFTERIVRL